MSKHELISRTGQGTEVMPKPRIRKHGAISDRVNLPLDITSQREKILDNLNKYKGSSKVFKNLNEVTDLSTKFLAENVFEITPKTLSKYKNQNISLPSVILELVSKINILYELGVEIFSSKMEFNKWLNAKSLGLGNIFPIKYLKTSTGIDLIYEELKRIEFVATA